jgi:hypothetical protein
MFERFDSAVYIPLLLAGVLTSGIALIGKIGSSVVCVGEKTA